MGPDLVRQLEIVSTFLPSLDSQGMGPDLVRQLWMEEIVSTFPSSLDSQGVGPDIVRHLYMKEIVSTFSSSPVSGNGTRYSPPAVDVRNRLLFFASFWSGSRPRTDSCRPILMVDASPVEIETNEMTKIWRFSLSTL